MSTTEEQYQNPKVGRPHFRSGEDFRVSTFTKFSGFLQANLAILPSEHAEDFEEFCHCNNAPCPLVYRSKEGEVEAPVLTEEESDIRTDLSAYQVLRHGKITDTVPDLVFHPWQNMVTFYLGCSFSFDDKLMNSGIQLRKSSSANVAMFKSNIQLNPVGPFDCNMVVSMRPIPTDSLADVFNLCRNLDFVHGAPIHIGRGEDIGIRDLKRVDYGYVHEVADGEVPCFWACGVTGMQALLGANLPLAFTHSPGSMFVCDVRTDDMASYIHTDVYPEADVVTLSKKHSRFAPISKNSLRQLERLDEEIMFDPGERGIQHLHIKEDLIKACLDLSCRASSVAILLGFPVFRAENREPAEENDGVQGAIYLARALQAMGVAVTFVVDSHAHVLRDTLHESVEQGFLYSAVDIISVGKEFTLKDRSVLFDVHTGVAKFSHLIAIERPSPGSNGKYHTMKARDISQDLEPMDLLFNQAQGSADIITIGIGDGGNEVGMGNVQSSVAKNIPCGETIGATTCADYLIAIGVSNWGGHAVAAGLYIARSCMVHDRYIRNGLGSRHEVVLEDFLMTDEQDEQLNNFIMKKGFPDGVTGKVAMTVDGLDYYTTHLPRLQAYRNIALTTVFA